MAENLKRQPKVNGKRKNCAASRTADNYCSCGFRIRGANHESGNHHKKISMKKN